MTRLKLLMTACCTAVLAILLVMTGSAQDMNTNQRTFLTFSAPVELPGVTLPAGRYCSSWRTRRPTVISSRC